ncbi:multicopper oxidase domain-containing protein [Alphaproteobacteria bacterium GH1-50]|uniref:Multicopper oxidase domain-containing protein n=1 Tax=Kangsaoukella pontilimi TaxID=2691042 RepID=A0A7C9ML19_9RHOB|nr:multicopper oxidase family protein [Kangsaoukella pontilimi]MXQ08875.1 multicopper oxidase domain-containing protein [Kangsaoukella pontilimi]
MITRRGVLAGGAALTVLGAPRPSLATTPGRLITQEASRQIVPTDYPETRLWRYALDGRTGPATGPTIRARQGDTLSLRLENGLARPTTVHWHGIRIDNAMDGVPGVTQSPVGPSETFDYVFDLPDAGTYWYHSHVDSVEQVARGLHGPLIVDEAEAPDVDDDLVLVLDDWRLDAGAQITDDFENRHDRSHAGRLGNVVTTNGDMDWRQSVTAGARLRLRLINVANARVFDLALAGVTGWIVATDGMPLAAPRVIEGPFALGPAQRLDLIVDIAGEVGDEVGLVELIRGEAYSQATFVVENGGSARTAAPLPLPPNPTYGVADATNARKIEIVMQGGAMRGLPEVMSGGVIRDGRSLMMEGLFWALSGQAGRPDTPLAEIAQGETVAIDFVNETAFPHAMHLHGHHFHEVAPDGSLGDFRDTTLVQPGQRVSTLFVAHNPGDWLLHCHMLAHHAAGMGTWIRVA